MRVVLVGTEVIKDFPLARFRQSEDYSSGISPFSAEGVFKSTRFTSLVVTELLAQYVEENNGNIDFEDMLRMFTLLHWVSSAPAYIILRIKPCLKLTKQISVTGRSMFQLSYFNMVLRYGNKQVLMNEHDVKFLLAEGMVVEILHNEDGTSLIGCAAPILHTIMLSNIRGPDLTLSSLPTTVDRIDPKWLLARTVENLSIQNIFHEKTTNSNNEPLNTPFKLNFSVFSNN
ncbi:hypothetical protein RclHR1_02290010 [Rhizophagus clarus]|uniref:Uncharacterized protein n=1 Tax=Rhizophagus clarus TaxID=94130 RepID=A0A2Z6R8G8_9GLOM|nr:hypothetical protein RclHR1_02290010 [Rhizophagus clarus]